MVVVVSVRVSDSSGAEQELTPSARTDTRNRMSRKYRRKLETDISQLHEGIVNLPFSKTEDKKFQIFFRTDFGGGRG